MAKYKNKQMHCASIKQTDSDAIVTIKIAPNDSKELHVESAICKLHVKAHGIKDLLRSTIWEYNYLGY